MTPDPRARSARPVLLERMGQPDPLAQMELTESGYEQITRLLVAAAQQHCQGRVISALEGGYNLRALGRSVVRHLVALS